MKQEEKLQLAFLSVVTLVLGSVFFLTPSLRPLTLLTILNVLILNPVIRFMVKKGISRVWAILLVYFVLTLFFIFGVSRLIQVIGRQWSGFIASLPTLLEAALRRLDSLEAMVKDFSGIEVDLGLHGSVLQSGAQLQAWALTHIPSLIGSLASAALLVPVFSFFILKDGDRFSSLYLALIPERFRKSAHSVLQKIALALGIFLRAKIFEALFFALMVYLGLLILDAPFAGLFALIAGLANTIPYLGPFIGAAPPLLIFGFSENLQGHFWPVVLVILIANLIDNFLVFPIFVARIVNLTPLTLLVSVAVGQELYGVIGMLLAVPSASIAKIVFIELKSIVYS